MRIAIDTHQITNGDPNVFAWGYGILPLLPTLLPEHIFVFIEYGGPDYKAKNVEEVHEFSTTNADHYFSLDKHGHYEEIPGVLTVLELDDKPVSRKPWWLFWTIAVDHFVKRLDEAINVVVPHQRLKKTLLSNYPVDPNKIIVVGHGLPPIEEFLITPADSVTRRITKEVYGKEHSYFLAPCYGHPSDNLERLFAAYDIFRERCPEPIQLLVESLGESPSRSVRKAKRAAKFKEDISFLSSLKPSERRKVVSSARAILFPSLSTRFPLPVLDAWTAEVPVLYTDNDILQGAGALVQGEDVNSIAEGIVSLVTTPFLASGLVENGKRRREAFQWEAVAQRVAEVIRSVSASA
ncbi:MAG: glycosyltransferase [Bacteroidota bacterium]